jgi:hypothetical protein
VPEIVLEPISEIFVLKFRNFAFILVCLCIWFWILCSLISTNKYGWTLEVVILCIGLFLRQWSGC